MTLQIPSLDDRTFDDLAAEARSLIRAYTPSWTDHNSSDPGITLLELFAYLTEMLIYRLNRVTGANKIAFLNLLRTEWPDANALAWQPTKPLDDEIGEAVQKLRSRDRAITVADFEAIAKGVPGVARAKCLPNMRIDNVGDQPRPVNAEAHITVVIAPNDADLQKIVQEFEGRCLLTTRLHVVPSNAVQVGVKVTVCLKPDAIADHYLDSAEIDASIVDELNNTNFGAFWNALTDAVKKKIEIANSDNPSLVVMKRNEEWLISAKTRDQTYTIRVERDVLISPRKKRLGIYRDIARVNIIGALTRFLDPIKGGTDGRGWPFGRAVHISEIYQLLDNLDFVDWVPMLNLEQTNPHQMNPSQIDLEPNDLVEAQIDPGKITIVQPYTLDTTQKPLPVRPLTASPRA
ncbi:MAG: hypothetical protein ACM3JD_11025 [Rudaea sp.]